MRCSQGIVFASSDHNTALSLRADGVIKNFQAYDSRNLWLIVHWIDIREEASDLHVIRGERINKSARS